MEIEVRNILENAQNGMTIGDKIAHERHHLETIPERVGYLVSLGVVRIVNPEDYIERQRQKILAEIEQLSQMDPLTPYYPSGEPIDQKWS